MGFKVYLKTSEEIYLSKMIGPTDMKVKSSLKYLKKMVRGISGTW